jgi:hypothetical protein
LPFSMRLKRKHTCIMGESHFFASLLPNSLPALLPVGSWDELLNPAESSVRCFKQIWKIGKVGKVGKVGKEGKVGKVGREGR